MHFASADNKLVGEVKVMKANRSIGCSVTECRYHAKTEPMCSLENIQVSKKESTAQTERDTECASFEKE